MSFIRPARASLSVLVVAIFPLPFIICTVLVLVSLVICLSRRFTSIVYSLSRVSVSSVMLLGTLFKPRQRAARFFREQYKQLDSKGTQCHFAGLKPASRLIIHVVYIILRCPWLANSPRSQPARAAERRACLIYNKSCINEIITAARYILIIRNGALKNRKWNEGSAQDRSGTLRALLEYPVVSLARDERRTREEN